MRIGKIKKVSTWQSEPAPETEAPAEQTTPSRALVALEAPAGAHLAADVHRHTPFLAHLLAMKSRHPQTRQHRRAETHEALSAYHSTAKLTGLRNPQ